MTIDWARTAMLEGVTLTTFRDAPWNAPFYARMGFRLLSGNEAGPRLTDLLRREAQRGLPLELRCGMRLDLARIGSDRAWSHAPASR